VFPEARHHLLVDDLLAHVVGKQLFQPVSYSYSHSPFVGRDENNDTIVVVLSAYAPTVSQILGKGIYVGAAQGRHGDNDHLMLRRLFELRQLRIERRLLLGCQDFGRVGNSPCQNNGRSGGRDRLCSIAVGVRTARLLIPTRRSQR